jgi:NAD(P)-dependent dehydrogenase (short-subunit alcohol dehydrogenase family)
MIQHEQTTVDKNDSVVIVTGATGNLGTAVTELFLEKGYRVVATVSKESSLQSIESHPNLDVQVVDLSNEKAAEKFIESTISKYKNIHAALLLVGGFAAGDITTTTGEVLKQQFALNFETAYYVARPLFAHMMQNNTGRLVFIGARPALLASYGKNLVAYSLSKSLLFNLANLLNATAKGTNVTATVISVSTIDTPANRASMPEANFEDWVTPAKLAGLLNFVVGDDSNILRETVLKAYNNG